MQATSPVVLEGDLTIYTVTQYKEIVLTGVQASSEPAIDLSQVDEIDSAGMQLLLFAREEAQRLEKQVRLIGCHPTVMKLLQLFGLVERFAFVEARH